LCSRQFGRAGADDTRTWLHTIRGRADQHRVAPFVGRQHRFAVAQIARHKKSGLECEVRHIWKDVDVI
jgi:hypothetical protein